VRSASAVETGDRISEVFEERLILLVEGVCGRVLDFKGADDGFRRGVRARSIPS